MSRQYRAHLSQALAAASVHAPDVIEAIVRADTEERGAKTLEHLVEAKTAAEEILKAVDAAIAIEMQPPAPEEAARRVRVAITGAQELKRIFSPRTAP